MVGQNCKQYTDTVSFKKDDILLGPGCWWGERCSTEA